MNFASAFISMTRGHKVARSHWSGYWHIVDGIIMIHTKDGVDLKLTDSDDIVYTISNCACDDWHIVDNYGVSKERQNMEQLKNAKWWSAACTRCLKTMCQTAIAMIGTSQMMEQVDLKVVVSSTALAGILSLLTSLAGLPEVDTTKENQ